MSHQHSNQQSNLQNNDSPSKPNVFTQEKFLPGAHRLKTNTSNNTNSPDLNKPKNEEDDDLGRSYSPSKYFGKRPSFEFRNLKSIEKPLLNRQFSEFKLKDYKSEKTTSKNLENIKVQFKVTEQIIEDEMPGSKSFLKKKANKPILKKAHFVDEVPIECIFKKEINGKFVERIMEDNKIKNQLLEKLLATKFVEYWKEIEKDAQVAIKFLSGVYCENLFQIFKEGIELSLVLSILTIFRKNYENNEKLLADYLENFPKILKFDVVISCLIPSEKEG